MGMELGALLIKLGVDACRMPDDVLVPVVSAPGPRCDESSLHLGTQLTTIMTDPSTLLDASWLAARVIPFVETQLRREAIHRRDCMWGHEGWEAHGLTLRSCDTERQTDVDTKLEAVLGPPTCRRHSAMTLTQPLALVYSDLPETVACSSISSRAGYVPRTPRVRYHTFKRGTVYFTCSECNL